MFVLGWIGLDLWVGYWGSGPNTPKRLDTNLVNWLEHLPKRSHGIWLALLDEQLSGILRLPSKNVLSSLVFFNIDVRLRFAIHLPGRHLMPFEAISMCRYIAYLFTSC